MAKQRLSYYLSAVHSSPMRKSYPLICREAAAFALREREMPHAYFTNMLHEHGAPDSAGFIGFRSMNHIIHQLFYAGVGRPSPNLEDKVRFSEVMDRAGLPIPVTLAVGRGGVLEKAGHRLTLDSKDIACAALKQIVADSSHGAVFIKPIDGIGGAGTYRVDSESIDSLLASGEMLRSIQTKNILIQEVVIQHPRLSEIYGKSVNALRVHSHRTKAGEVTIPSALARFGARGGIVDNGSRGGIFAPVDNNTWTITGPAKSYLNRGGRSFVAHPDTGTELVGYQLPFREEVERLVTAAASLFDNEVVGWDIALTPDGPVCIEGNECPHLVLAQIACGGFRAHPQWSRIFSPYIG